MTENGGTSLIGQNLTSDFQTETIDVGLNFRVTVKVRYHMSPTGEPSKEVDQESLRIALIPALRGAADEMLMATIIEKARAAIAYHPTQ